jgi:hypothetical protein
MSIFRVTVATVVDTFSVETINNSFQEVAASQMILNALMILQATAKNAILLKTYKMSLMQLNCANFSILLVVVLQEI